MTEHEWRACIDPEKILIFLRGKASDRKLRLAACACCRRMAHLLDDRSRNLLNLSEQYIDGLAVHSALSAAAASHNEVIRQASPYTAPHIAASIVSTLTGGGAWALAWNTVSEARRAIQTDSPQADVYEEGKSQSAIVRDIFNHLFRPVPINAAWVLWNDGTVRRIAQAIYDQQDFGPMPILGDALEDAGCDNADMLNHCRQPGGHVRGCWVIDALLGKE